MTQLNRPPLSDDEIPLRDRIVMIVQFLIICAIGLGPALLSYFRF